ncbi:MAG: hypothetical protein L6W00_05645 [Lentisphaeria bacterium]|nr:MAG: hypothetical protein L6W00_05645 [Lentisphaeria bacterium]
MNQWMERNAKYTLVDADSQFSIAFAGMKFEESDLKALAPKFERAAREMARIEAGEIKNPDEHRKVTHFTDRRSYPESELFRSVQTFAEEVRSGRITGETGKKVRRGRSQRHRRFGARAAADAVRNQRPLLE